MTSCGKESFSLTKCYVKEKRADFFVCFGWIFFHRFFSCKYYWMFLVLESEKLVGNHPKLGFPVTIAVSKSPPYLPSPIPLKGWRVLIWWVSLSVQSYPPFLSRVFPAPLHALEVVGLEPTSDSIQNVSTIEISIDAYYCYLPYSICLS